VLAVVAFLAGACTGETVRTPIVERTGESTTGTLTWVPCQNDERLRGLGCTTVLVPLDPERPDGPSIELALARRPASGPSDERIGSLLINPGGPGASGIELVPQLASSMDPRVLDRFDLVGFDPRGVGNSSPVRCIDDDDALNALDGDPDTPAEIDRTVAVQREILQTCLDRHGELLTHLSTTTAAHDLDRIREALGDEMLSYLGFSYGTELGATYAALYPDRVRVMVLDGAVAPGLGDEELALTQAKGFEQAFTNFADACRTDTRCAARPDARALYGRVRTMAEQAPIPVSRAGEQRDLSIGDFQMGVVSALYDQAMWAYLARGLAEAAAGDGSTLLALSDVYHERRADGSYPNNADANLAISCADTTERFTLADTERAAADFGRAAPLFGTQLGWSLLSCAGWPTPADGPTTVRTTTDAPILVVGTVNDPATPYAWARQLTDALQPTAHLLTWEGQGHTAYLKSDCITEAVDAVLVELRLPADGTRCPDDSDSADAFAGVAPDLRDALMEGSGLDRKLATCIAEQVANELDPADLTGLYQGEVSSALEALIARAATRCAGGR